MKNLKQLSAIVLCTVFAATQVSLASVDTGLGAGNGGAVINNATGGYAGMDTGLNSATLNFTGNSHVNWNTLNVNSNETLNFNAINGANGLTVLNTVNQGMSKIYGQINANNGISQLIISNPNGVLFDGAKFTTAGDVNVTTRDMTGVDVNNLTNGTYTKFRSTDWGTNGNEDLIQVQVKDSNFAIGGDFNIYAPKIVGANSTINANTLKLVTANGADYLANPVPVQNKVTTKLTAMNINGDVVVTNDVGAFVVENGGTINGDLTANTGGWIRVNETSNNTPLNITGDVNLAGHGEQSIFRHSIIGGDVTMTNDGGFVDMGNVVVGGDANLTTTGFEPIDSNKFNHYIHVLGDTVVNGDLNIESSQNIHIGNYDINTGELLPGSLNVGGDINAHTTAGHITTTIDTTANNIKYNAEKYNDGTRDYGGNILTDGKTVLTANTYQFEADGYIGGLQDTAGLPVDDQVISIMENYTHIPTDIATHDYLIVNGGTITKLDTPKTANGKDVQTYIKSNNDLIVNGANAGVINLVAPDKKITVTGDVHAKEINVGGRTGTLQLDFPNRDFTTNYTNIKDGVVKTIAPTDEITYELTNKPGTGYNSPDFQQTNGTNTTYLIGPGAPTPPTPPTPPQNNPTNPPSDDNVRVRNIVPEDPVQPAVNTPIAYAADLDDDDGVPCRKNVDGSVTVVRAYPMAN